MRTHQRHELDATLQRHGKVNATAKYEHLLDKYLLHLLFNHLSLDLILIQRF